MTNTKCKVGLDIDHILSDICCKEQIGPPRREIHSCHVDANIYDPTRKAHSNS